MKPDVLPIEFKPSSSRLRAIVDPRGTLPDVSLYYDYGTMFGVNTYHIVCDGGYAGEFVLDKRTDTSGDEVAFFSDIRRDIAANDKRGIGLATYLLVAEKYGNYFGSDTQLSEHSLKMWRRLCAFGIAQCVNEPKELQNESFYKFVGASYRINP